VEVIVVDDGSGEKEAAAIKTLCEELNVVYVRHDHNRGMAVGRNTGVAKSKGKWVMFLDDDVIVGKQWFTYLRASLRRQPPYVLGIEGRVEPSGDGVWDREVQNREGKSYLTCHMAYRRAEIDKTGWFDPQFEHEGPYAEDHELASRALAWGEIRFVRELYVTHLPRKVSLLRHIRSSWARTRRILDAEYYFFEKHPERYHLFRHHRTFWLTYRSYLLRNFVNEFRRRKFTDLIRHPLQTCALLISSLVEQAAAWALLPGFLRKADRPFRFAKELDIPKTAGLWKIPEAAVNILRVKRSIYKRLLSFSGKKHVNIRLKTLHFLNMNSSLTGCKVFLRLDDFFKEETDAILRFCTIMKELDIPYCAAVPGDDLMDKDSLYLWERVVRSGGEIAVHGFSHTGKFGPYESEILQMTFPELDRRTERVMDFLKTYHLNSRIFIPPFNGIGRKQIIHLLKHFRIVCGGPETARFTDGFLGPVVLNDGGLYFPAFHPFYGDSISMLESRIPRYIGRIKGYVCLSFHIQDEKRDEFECFKMLLNRLPCKPQPWTNLFSDIGSL